MKAGKFYTSILEAIKACDDFIVILNHNVFNLPSSGTSNLWTVTTSVTEMVLAPIPSDTSNETDWLIQEIKYAMELGKNIIPVLLQGFEWPKELPTSIQGLNEFNPIKYDKDVDFEYFYNNKLLDFLKSNPTQPIQPKEKNLAWVLLAFVVIGFVIVALVYINRPILLLVGGGSVKGHFEKKGIPISTSRKWVYLPTSTGAALPIIAKEIDVKQNNGNDKSRQYNLVIFSAMKAKGADLISDSITRDRFIKNIGHVIGVKIGSNDLMVVLKDDKYFNQYLGNDSLITPMVLAEIIKDKNVTVYTTSNNNGNRGISGTFKRYNEILKSYDINLESIHCEEFNLNQTYGYFNNNKKPFVILETTTFVVDSNDISAQWFTLPVYDSTKQTKIQNDLYVYFVARINPNANINKFYVPTQVRRFLKKIGANLPDDKALGFTDSLIQEYTIDGKFIKYTD